MESLKSTGFGVNQYLPVQVPNQMHANARAAIIDARHLMFRALFFIMKVYKTKNVHYTQKRGTSHEQSLLQRMQELRFEICQ
jgi:5'-3' exonuclease